MIFTANPNEYLARIKRGINLWSGGFLTRGTYFIGVDDSEHCIDITNVVSKEEAERAYKIASKELEKGEHWCFDYEGASIQFLRRNGKLELIFISTFPLFGRQKRINQLLEKLELSPIES